MISCQPFAILDRRTDFTFRHSCTDFIPRIRTLFTPIRRAAERATYSTVTLFARFLGWSTSVPFRIAQWYASSCSGTVYTAGAWK